MLGAHIRDWNYNNYANNKSGVFLLLLTPTFLISLVS